MSKPISYKLIIVLRCNHLQKVSHNSLKGYIYASASTWAAKFCE